MLVKVAVVAKRRFSADCNFFNNGKAVKKKDERNLVSYSRSVFDTKNEIYLIIKELFLARVNLLLEIGI